MQELVDLVSGAAEQCSLKINIKKTECLIPTVSDKHRHSADIHTDKSTRWQHWTVKNSVCLGSTISDRCHIRQLHCGLARRAYGKLRDGLLINHHVSITVRCKVYLAIVL